MTRKARTSDAIRVVPLDQAQTATGRHIATVPGILAPVYPVELPSGLRHGTRTRIARRQIADRLGLPEAELEMRPLGDDPEWTRVLVSDADASAAWRAQAAAGCVAILPDYLALPTAEDLWVLHATEVGIAARLGPQDGFGANPALAVAQLRLAAAAEPPAAVLLIGSPQLALTELLEELGLPVCRSAEDLAAQGHPTPRPTTAQHGRANLLEPADAAVQKLRGALRRWRTPAVLAILALAMWTGGTLWQIRAAETRLADVRRSTDVLLRDTFVPRGPILDVRLQVSRRLSEIGRSSVDTSGASPIDTLRRAAAVFATDMVTLQSVSYRPQAGLEAAVLSPDFAAVDGLAANLRAAGLAVDVLDARAEDGGQVRARLRLGES